MKKITLILFSLILIPLLSMGQVNVTGTGGTGYYLTTAEGDTLQLRGSTPFYSTLRTAYTDAMNYSAENFGATVHLRSNVDERITADFGYYDEPEIIELPGDTVYVDREVIITETDTVFVELPAEVVYDTIYVETLVTEIDTAFVDVPGETIYDTTYVDREVIVTDTVYVDNIVYETVYDTTYVDREVFVTDTVFVDQEVIVTEIDTVYVDNIVYETVYDTLYVDREVVVTDTVYVDLPADTVYVTETEYITEVDTVYVDQEIIVTETDTLFVEVPGETVYDTVYVEVPAERPVYEDLMVESRYRDTLPPYNIITTDVASIADSLDITYICGTIIEGQHSTSAWNVIFSHSYDTECIEDLTIDYTFWKDGVAHEATEYFPAFILGGDMADNQYIVPLTDMTQWTQYWDMSSTISTNGMDLVIEDTTSGSNVWINENVPTATEMEVYMVASTQASTPHIRMLATPYGYAQDMYYSSGLTMPDSTTGGLQYAYWDNSEPDSSWSQGMYTLVDDIAVEGTGASIHMLMRVENNTTYIKAWFGDTEPTEWLYVAPVAAGYENIEGALGVGAHSVATRNIEYLSVGINGANAPRR